MKKQLQNLKKSQKMLAKLSANERNDLIINIAKSIKENEEKILQANEEDIKNATHLSAAMQDRLKINKSRLDDICNAIINIAKQSEVIGNIEKGWIAKSKIKISKISVPIGVIAAIYEARPNVTLEVAALCIKTANACALKGGKEAKNTNLAFIEALNLAFKPFGFCSVCYLDISREEVLNLIQMSDFIDLIIPRGGENLVKFVSQNSKIPVLKHDKGLCHIYVDKAASLQKAIDICINAKCSRPSVCNAAETFLIHKDIAEIFLPKIKIELDRFNVEIFGCEKTQKIISCHLANEENFASEYDDFKLNIAIVENLQQALEHIEKFGSLHSEAIISEDYSACEEFLAQVDASCVFANASTRFNDGGEFGFGAEVGISTNRLHARGPVGAQGLCSYKYIIYGNGQIR